MFTSCPRSPLSPLRVTSILLLGLLALRLNSYAIAEASALCNPAGQMTQARADHTTTLLDNGTVLVAGGEAADSRNVPRRLASSEIYDPGRGFWLTAGDLDHARSGHTATLLANGQVLVTGGRGRDGSLLASTEVFDPARRSWSEAGSLSSARINHTATLLADGSVLVAGGWNGGVYLAAAERYDPGSRSWTPTGDLHAARAFHSATLLPDGRVLVLGGAGLDPSLDSAEIYEPASGFWMDAAPLRADRAAHTATLLPNGRLLLVGGLHFVPTYGLIMGHLERQDSVELYDRETGGLPLSVPAASLPRQPIATLLTDGAVLIAGGVSDKALVYEPGAERIVEISGPREARAGHTATLLPSGRVLLIGGLDGTHALRSSELYEPSRQAWSPIDTNCSTGVPERKPVP